MSERVFWYSDEDGTRKSIDPDTAEMSVRHLLDGEPVACLPVREQALVSITIAAIRALQQNR